MPAGASGLQRDLEVLRRRAWLFIPFAVIGLVVAVFAGKVSGESGEVATFSLDTSARDIATNGDRGLRVFEAQQMTGDPRFREKVSQAAGEPGLDFGRFSINLVPLTQDQSVTRGTLTIGIRDPDRAKADKYRQAFVDVFIAEFTSPDGLWRTRYVETRERIAEDTTARFNEVYAQLTAKTGPLGIYVPPLLDHRGWASPAIEYYGEFASLDRELAEVKGALDAIRGVSEGAAAGVAGSVLGQPVAAGDATAALTAKKAALESALSSLRKNSPVMAELSLDTESLRLLDEARGLRVAKDDAYIRLANAEMAVTSAESFYTVVYSSSGSRATSLPARVAVALAITIVFGLVAIYGWEWLRPSVRTDSDA